MDLFNMNNKEPWWYNRIYLCDKDEKFIISIDKKKPDKIIGDFNCYKYASFGEAMVRSCFLRNIDYKIIPMCRFTPEFLDI